MPLSKDPADLQAAIDELGAAESDDKHRAMTRRVLTRHLARAKANDERRALVAERAEAMTPAQLAESVPRW